MTDNKTQNRAWLSIVAVVLLFVMWAVTTYAFVASFVSENDNLFETARVKIVLNEGKLIFEHIIAIALEPAMATTSLLPL